MPSQVRDPVHNFIGLRKKEADLLNTNALQRLRGIRQLAMASLVYPGALHTRFDHTLGVMHVAGMMAESLRCEEDDVDIVRCAALLHDIGHGPFSHVSEYALDRYADRSKIEATQKKEKIHELVTSIQIKHDPQIVAILGQMTCNRVAKLLGQGHGEPILRSIISGPLDADKQDYLLRDSLFCGVKYGVFDLHQLHRSLRAVGPPNERDLMIRGDGIHAVEQYVLAKYYLTTNVYRHKVRLITDQMIVRSIILGVEKDENEDLRRLYAFDNSIDFAAEYSKWDDARFLQAFGANGSGGLCNKMLNRLRERNLLKRIFTAKPIEFAPEVREGLLYITKREMAAVREKIEAQIAEKISETTNQEIDANFVIVHAFDIKSVREMSRNDESGILVAQYPNPRPFEDESTLFASINEALKEEHIEVYAPITWSTPTDRDRICNSLRDPIKVIIESNCLGLIKEKTK